MRKILIFVVLASTPLLPAQQRFEKQDTVCPIPADRFATVDRDVALALTASKAVVQDFPRKQFQSQIAAFDACLGHYEASARLGDSAYPSGSEAESTLGHALAIVGKLALVPELGKAITHGTHSFLYGVVEGLVEQKKFTEADARAAQIASPEVRFSASLLVVVGRYKAGDKSGALAQLGKLYDSLPAEQKAQLA